MRGAIGALCGIVLAVFGASTAAAAPSDVPNPKVTGPIKVVEGSRPWFATEVPLAQLGYVEEEFFFEGTASDGSAYKTRMLVRRPASAARFSGTVVAEWFNVTGNYDAEWDWFNSWEFFTRRGWIWVGVSAQYAGVQALRNFNSSRYGTLQVSDTQSPDIWGQAGKALRFPQGVDPLAGMRPKVLIADGHSQSADKLSQYYNDQHTKHGLFDGFFLRGFNRAVRTDLPTKAIRLLSENDIAPAMRALSGQDPNPDSDKFRRWEVAGASHVTWKEWRQSDALINRDRGYGTPRQCTKPPFSRVSFHHAQNALYDHLARWIQGGPAPPVSPRMEFNADGVTLKRDARGFVVGGIRLPDVAVPTALQTGENNGPVFCVLYGSREGFGDAELQSLYPDRATYVRKVDAAIRDAVDRGYMLAEDAPEICRAARAAQFGWTAPQPPVADLSCPFEVVPSVGAAAGSAAAAAGPTVAARASLGLPPASTCPLRVRVRAPRGQKVRSAVFYVNGKRTKTVRGRALRRPVRLLGLPSQLARVMVVVRTRSGRTYVQTRNYRSCRR